MPTWRMDAKFEGRKIQCAEYSADDIENTRRKLRKSGDWCRRCAIKAGMNCLRILRVTMLIYKL